MTQTTPHSDSSTPGTARRVLIVDDEPHILHVMGTKLRSAGFDVTEARDGEEALQIALASPPEIVVTDMQMPSMSGLQFAQAMFASEITRKVPVLMLTARGHIVPGEDLQRTNIRELLGKPFSARQILERVCQILEQHESTSRTAA